MTMTYQIQRRLWLRKMWHLQVRGGRTCTGVPSPAATPAASGAGIVPHPPTPIESVTSPRHYLSSSLPQSFTSLPSSTTINTNTVTTSVPIISSTSSIGRGYQWDHPSIAATEAGVILPMVNGQPVVSPTHPSTLAPPPLSVPIAMATPITLPSSLSSLQRHHPLPSTSFTFSSVVTIPTALHAPVPHNQPSPTLRIN
jgi:hypothetical protein